MSQKNRRQKYIKYTLGSMIVLSSLMGVSYAKWTETLQIKGTVSSGQILLSNVEVSKDAMQELAVDQIGNNGREARGVKTAIENNWGKRIVDTGNRNNQDACICLKKEWLGGKYGYGLDVVVYFVIENEGTIPIQIGKLGKKSVLGETTVTRYTPYDPNGVYNLTNNVNPDEIYVVGQSGGNAVGTNNHKQNLATNTYTLAPGEQLLLAYIEGSNNITIGQYSATPNDQFTTQFTIPYHEGVTDDAVWTGTMHVEWTRNGYGMW